MRSSQAPEEVGATCDGSAVIGNGLPAPWVNVRSSGLRSLRSATPPTLLHRALVASLSLSKGFRLLTGGAASLRRRAVLHD